MTSRPTLDALDYELKSVRTPKIGENRLEFQNNEIRRYPCFAPLSSTVQKNSSQNMACLWDGDETVINKAGCVATGWGKDRWGDKGKYQVLLKHVELDLVDNYQCQERTEFRRAQTTPRTCSLCKRNPDEHNTFFNFYLIDGFSANTGSAEVEDGYWQEIPPGRLVHLRRRPGGRGHVPGRRWQPAHVPHGKRPRILRADRHRRLGKSKLRSRCYLTSFVSVQEMELVKKVTIYSGILNVHTVLHSSVKVAW